MIHIYGARAIFLLFYDNQNTESKSRAMGIGVAIPIFTQKNVKVPIGKRYPYSTSGEKNIVVVLHIYGARSIFLLFFDHQETEYK